MQNKENTLPTPHHKSFNIAMVQIASHPSIRIGASDFVSEPFVSHGPNGPLQELWNNHFAVDDLQSYCRDRYLVWHRSRVEAIVEWFRNLPADGLPDVVVFPEGAIPRKFLHCLHKKIRGRRTGPIVFAGTHAFENSEEAWNDYRKLGVKTETLIKLSHFSADTVSVLPILMPDGSVTLRPKLRLSPWEYTAIGVSQDVANHGWVISDIEQATTEKGSPSPLKVTPFVCSEALQHLDGVKQDVDAIVILSYDREPSHFTSFEEHFAKNQKPVAYCNDGRFGGTHLHVASDKRNENWFSQAPQCSKLPPGDGVLLVQVPLSTHAPTIGVANPQPSYRIIRLVSVVPEDASSSVYRVSRSLKEMHDDIHHNLSFGIHVNCKTVANTCTTMLESESPTAIQRLQLQRLLSLARRDVTPLNEWSTFASDCLVTERHYEHSLHTLRRFAVIDRSTHLAVDQGVALTPCTLDALERTLSAHCLSRISLLIDQSSSSATEVLVRIRSRLLEFLGVTHVPSATGTMNQVLINMRSDAVEAANVSLCNELARIVERFGATSGMLFIASEQPSGVQKLVSDIMVNTPVSRIERLATQDNGIVGYVASTKRPYISECVSNESLDNDAWLDPYYKCTVRSTRSEMAVPILLPTVDGQGSELLGVVNLESRTVGAFSVVQLQQLQSESLRLAVDICVLQASKDSRTAVVWHPRIHGWGLGSVLDRLCYNISTVHSGGQRSPTVSCTVWYSDQTKGKVFALGTSRYDYEYIADEMLDAKDSFIGWSLDTLAAGEAYSGRVEDLPRFRRRLKADRMELTRVTVAPFEVTSDILESVTTLKGLVALYSFAHERHSFEGGFETVFSKDNVHRLALLFGRVLSQSQDLRLRCAIADLCSRMDYFSLPGERAFDAIRDALLGYFSASGVTVLRVKDDVATVVSTTGVDNPKGRYRCKRGKWSTQVQGFTRYLMSGRYATLRKHDVPDPSEPCEEGGRVFYVTPQNVIRESGAASSTEHRRFLGSNIVNNGRVVGVIRLVRGNGDRPFIESDEVLLAALSRLISRQCSTCDRWHYGTAPAAYLWSSRWLNGWLQHLCRTGMACVPSVRPVLASVRYGAQDESGEWYLRLLGYHSTGTRVMRRDVESVPRRKRNIGWVTIDCGASDDFVDPLPRVVCFDAKKTSIYSCGIDHGAEVATGINVPVCWIGSGRVCPGVVSIDYKERIMHTQEGVLEAFMESLVLSGMADYRVCDFTKSESVLPIAVAPARGNIPERILPRGGDNLFESFRILWRASDIEEFSMDDVFLSSAGDPPCGSQSFRALASRRFKWSRIEARMRWLSEAERLGLRYNSASRVFMLPLRVGAFSLFCFVGRLKKTWQEEYALRASTSPGMDRHSVVGRSEWVKDERNRMVIESAFAMKVSKAEELRMLCKAAFSIAEEWSTFSGAAGPLWRDCEIGFERDRENHGATFDKSGLVLWRPVLRTFNGVRSGSQK